MQHQHKPRKRFGQNFLTDLSVIESIKKIINPKTDDFIVEIGPGTGALTDQIIGNTANLSIIEFDRDLIQLLKKKYSNYTNLSIYEADALHFDFSQCKTSNSKIRLIGNLPYNISTPLIFHLLDQITIIQDMHFMLQKEVVNRMAATPGNSNYGRLSIMIQYFCKVYDLLEIPPSAFNPAPKVDSKVVRLIPHDQLPFIAKNFEHFSTIVRTAFNQRRKTLRKSLKNFVLADEHWKACEIDPNARPETLSIKDFVCLSNYINEPVK